MLIITKEQLAKMGNELEREYKNNLIKNKNKKYNAENKINEKNFKERILINYETARFYKFDEIQEIEKFIDYTFMHEILNCRYPVPEELHQVLSFPNRSSEMKFEIMDSIF